MSHLTREQREELRDLGWNATRRKASRPGRISRRDKPSVNEDVEIAVPLTEAQ